MLDKKTDTPEKISIDFLGIFVYVAHGFVYNKHMESTARVWICDQCKHIWLRGEIVPTHCAKCRSRRWNDGYAGEPKVDNGRAGSDAVEDQLGSGDVAGMPVLRNPKGISKRLHPVQSVREELDARVGHIQAPTHQDHLTFIAGDKRYCSTCVTYY